MDKKKTNVKTTMDFFKQKRAKENVKKQLSSTEKNINSNSSSTASSEFNSTIQTAYKSDIFQIESYLIKIKEILVNFSEKRENLTLYNKDFNKKIDKIKEYLNKDTKDLIAVNRMNSLNINYLFKEYKCNDKDTLISDIAYENFTLKLLLDKLDDLFFLINLKMFDSQKFSKNYQDNNISQIINVNYFCENLTNINEAFKLDSSMKSKEEDEAKIESVNNKNATNISSKNSFGDIKISSEPKEISIEIVNDITSKINEMKKFSDFLNFDYDQDEFFREIFEKIRELFYIYNKHMFDPIVDLINTKFQVKSDLSNKVQIVLKNEVNDCFENVTLMRKVLEDNFKENQNKITELNNEKRIIENKYKELETKFNKQQKTLEEIGNRDYSNYYKQMKESNELFLKEFEKIEKQRNEKLYEQYEKQLEKNKLLKKEIKDNQSEIFALKKKIDNLNSVKDKTEDDYINALQEQFEDAKESFKEEISNLTDEFYKKRNEMKQKCTALENENRHLKGIQASIIKKLDTMESLFSK